MSRSAILYFTAILCLWLSPAHAETRRWTARAGNFSTDAELIDVKEGNVVLKKADNSTITVPLDRLSLADVKYVEKFLSDATAAVGKPVDDSGTASAAAKPGKSTGKLGSTSTDGEPPLARANSSQWQVRPDPAPDAVLRDVSISLPEGAGSGHLLFPSTPSRFLGFFIQGIKPSIQAWDLRTGDRFGPLAIEGHAHPEPVLSPDGDTVAIAQLGKPKLQLWSLKKKALVKEIVLGERSVHIQQISFAGPRRLLIGSGFNEGLRVFDPRTGAETAKVEVKTIGLGERLAISPGGVYLALADSGNKAIRIYDLRNGELAGELDNEGEDQGFRSVSSMKFSADGQEFAAIYDSPRVTLSCWSLKTGKRVARHEFNRPLHELSGSHDGGFDFIPGNKGWLLGGKAVVDREKGGPIWVGKLTDGRETNFIRMLDGERMLVSTGTFDSRKLTTERLPWGEINKSAAVVEKGGTAMDVGLPPVTKANADAAKQITLSAQQQDWKVTIDALPAAPQLADQSIPITPLPQFSEPIFIAPVGLQAVVAGRSSEKGSEALGKHRFRRFDLKSGKEDGAIEPAFPTKALDVNLEGTRLVVESTKGNDRVDLFDFAGGKHVVGFRPYQGQDSYKSRVSWAALVGNDRLITLNSEGRVILWSIPDCRALYTFTTPNVRDLALSRSRKYMVVRVEGAYQVLNVATAEQVGTLKAPETTGGRFVHAYEFSPDGKKLAAISRDATTATLLCWDLTNGDLLHQYPLDVGEDVTWASGNHVLIHRPLTSDREVVSGRIPPHRSDLVDLGTGRIAWRYQLSLGRFGSQTVGDIIWYTTTKDFGQPYRLVGTKLPGKDTLASMADAPRPVDLLPAGTAVTLDVSVSITGDALADKVLQDDVRGKITEYLTKRGLKIQDRSALALRVSLREKLTGQFLELRPILGGVAGRYQVRGKLLTCRLELTDVTRQSLWSREQTIPVREEIPRTGIPRGTAPDDFVRQQQWTDAQNWLSTAALPTEIHERWAYAGMGESVLTPNGEALLTLDVPSK